MAKLRVYHFARGERRGSWHSRRVIERRLPAPPAYRFSATVGQLSLGRHDPAARFIDGAYWLATPTPGGPASLRLHREGATLVATGYGPGAEWVVDHADAIAGLRDRLDGFDALAAAHPVVADLARTYRGVRLPATGQVFPRVLRAVFSRRSPARRRTGRTRRPCAASGPRRPARCDRLCCRPTPERWPPRRTGSSTRSGWSSGAPTRSAGSPPGRPAGAVRGPAEVTARLTAIPGVGPWTAAEVVRIAFGDPDAVSVGDYHIPNTVAWALAGEPAATTPGCWRCWSRSGGIAAGSACCWRSPGSRLPGTARGCRSARSPGIDPATAAARTT